MPKMPIWRSLKQKNLVQLLRYLSPSPNIIRLGHHLVIPIHRLSTSAGTSSQITNFINANGSQYDILKFNANFAYDTRNKAILPDKGAFQRINAVIAVPSFGNSLEYYKINYEAKWFKDLYNEDFVLVLGGRFGYGDSYGDTSELALL